MEDSHSSASPLTFTDFLEKMKDPRAADLVRSIKAFIASFKDKTVGSTADEYGQSVQQFLRAAEQSFRTHPLWAGSSSAELDAASEGLEKYVMTKLYDKCFRASPTDREGDEILALHMRALEFIRPEHLDIPDYFRNEAQWTLAQKELHKINAYKAPRDKLICILNCCRVITNLLNVKSSGPAGADDFFPVLVYVVIRTNPPNLKSNLEFIRRFRAESRLVSEAEYFYTNMQSAAQFIELINVDRLSIDPDTFLAHMAAAGVPLDRLTSSEPSAPVANMENIPREVPGRPQPAALQATRLASSLPDVVVKKTVAELEAEGTKLLLASEDSGKLRQKYKFLHSSFPDLTVQDAEELLGCYKELVLRYETLSLALQNQRNLDMSQWFVAEPSAVARPQAVHPDFSESSSAPATTGESVVAESGQEAGSDLLNDAGSAQNSEDRPYSGHEWATMPSLSAGSLEALDQSATAVPSLQDGQYTSEQGADHARGADLEPGADNAKDPAVHLLQPDELARISAHTGSKALDVSAAHSPGAVTVEDKAAVSKQEVEGLPNGSADLQGKTTAATGDAGLPVAVEMNPEIGEEQASAVQQKTQAVEFSPEHTEFTEGHTSAGPSALVQNSPGDEAISAATDARISSDGEGVPRGTPEDSSAVAFSAADAHLDGKLDVEDASTVPMSREQAGGQLINLLD